MDRASSRVMPENTPAVQGVASTTRVLLLDRSTIIVGLFLRSGWRRISTLARRWVMSRQAIFMGVVGWGKDRELDEEKNIEHVYTCQEI